MSFTATFYSLSKRTNSTKTPAGSGVSYDCRLKAPSSILDPVLELKLPAGSVPEGNYCYIPSFSRYYWVTDKVYQLGTWNVYLQRDSLSSFKSAIGASNLYVLRSASEYDGSIIDTMYPYKVAYTSAVTDQSEAAWWAIAPSVSSGAFIVGVRGRVSASQAAGGVTYLVMTPAQYKAFTEKLFADDLGSYQGTDPLGIGDTLAKMIFNPAQYITGVTWLPGVPSQVSAASSAWQVGWWNLGESLPILNPASRLLYSATIALPQHPQAAARGSYMNAAPSTDRLLYLPRVGIVPLRDPILATAASLSITLQVDPISGEGIYSLSAGGVTFDMIHCQIGVNVPLSSNEMTLQDAIGAVSSAVNPISAADNGNYTGAITGSLGSIGSALSVLEPHIVQLSSASGYLGLVGAGICSLYSVFRQTVPDDNTEHGRPLCQQKTLSTLSGYIQVLNGDIEIAAATRTELDEIRGFLESGFYYE